MGTAAYMAPEQAAGKVRDTGPAADVYALGALLYTCLTGQPPFEGPQLDVLMRVVSEEPVPPSRLAAKVPRDLETICLKCLSKEPARRYASAEELADDLRRFQKDEPIRARPVGRVERAVKWVRRHKAISALLLLTLLGVAGIVWKSIDAEQKKSLALKEAEKAKKTRDLFVSAFKRSDQKDEGSKLFMKQFLENCDRRIATDFSDDPELKEGMEEEIEELYTTLKVSTPQAMILRRRNSLSTIARARFPRQAVSQTLLYQDDRLILGDDANVRLAFLWDFRKNASSRAETYRFVTEDANRGMQCSNVTTTFLMTFVPLQSGTFYMGLNFRPGPGLPLPMEIKEDFEIAVA